MPGRRRSGDQPRHEGRTLRQVDDPDEVRTYQPGSCVCGRSLRHAQVVSTKRRQVFDLPDICPDEVEHRFARCACRCGLVVDAGAADGALADVSASVSYGLDIPRL